MLSLEINTEKNDKHINSIKIESHIDYKRTNINIKTYELKKNCSLTNRSQGIYGNKIVTFIHYNPRCPVLLNFFHWATIVFQNL